MITETTDLVAEFTKTNGGTHKWRYKDVDPSLPADEIKEACELLTTLDIFEQDGVKLFDSVLRAKFVTTIETLLFDLEHEPEQLTPEVEQPKESTCEEVRCFEVLHESEEGTIIPNALPQINFTSIQPSGRHYDRLSKIDSTENTEATVTINEDSLPPLRNEPPLEIIGGDVQKQKADTAQSTEMDTPDIKERHGLIRWIHRIRSRNKEAPDHTPQE